MSKYRLGEFEEVVLLTVAVLYGKAYGVSILGEIEERLNREVSIGSLRTVLNRLEKKGCLSSEFGESTAMRGGKRKRFFKVTKYGQKVLQETRQQRQLLWEAIPKAAFE
ncbi:MAG: PadR family transcriptional regulator [Saprospiraceae bacterium]|nr:PadR family transcriptional regulator [Saprospiraceae bacterium]